MQKACCLILTLLLVSWAFVAATKASYLSLGVAQSVMGLDADEVPENTGESCEENEQVKEALSSYNQDLKSPSTGLLTNQFASLESIYPYLYSFELLRPPLT